MTGEEPAREPDPAPEELAAAVDEIFGAAPPPPERLTPAALDELDAWVRGTLVPVYAREVDTARMWCARWWDHLEAVARLWALYLSWQALHDPRDENAATGPAVWQRDYLDPVMDRLRAPDGPFGGCMSRPESTQHTLPLPPACAPRGVGPDGRDGGGDP